MDFIRIIVCLYQNSQTELLNRMLYNFHYRLNLHIIHEDVHNDHFIECMTVYDWLSFNMIK